MQTKAIKTYSIALCLACFLPGCTNALYFYETEKISLIVEARPDSTQPVQGSLGIKQRVVLIAPKKSDASKKNNISDTPKKNDNCDPPKKIDNDDAVSAISSFSFNIIPKAGTIFNPVLIQTAFITGDAAACLKETEAQNAAQAIQQDLVVTPVTKDLQSRRENAAAFIKGLSPNDLDTLATAIDKEPGTNALLNILSAIAAADTTTSFEVINQKLNVLFGRSF